METMEESKQHYKDGLSYEMLVRYVLQNGETHFAGELQHLLGIETGRTTRMRGQPTLLNWRNTIRKKLLRTTKKLLARKRMSTDDRESLEGLNDFIENAPTALQLNEAVKLLWPIAKKVIDRK